MPLLVAISIAVFLATFLGGSFALRNKDKLHLILGFSAGAVLGVAFLDLLPEAIDLAGVHVSQIVIGAILFYMVIDRVFLKHSHTHHEESHEHEHRGTLRASSLVVHSFLDGLAIGFAFRVSPSVGVVVAAAVLAHDFSDGINTVAAILKSGKGSSARLWLFADAIAPVIGIIIGTMISVSSITLGYVLAVFTGFFIYIALSDLVPESFHSHPKKWTTIMTVLGAGFIALVMHFAAL